MRRYLIILILIGVGITLKGQVYESPQLKKNRIAKKVYGTEIEYIFPDTVVNIIDLFINQYNDSSQKYFIEFAYKNSDYELRMYERQKNVPIDSTSLSNLLISSTHRYCIVGEMRIPVYFDVDKVFGSFNFTMTATALVITLSRKSYDKFVVTNVSVTN